MYSSLTLFDNLYHIYNRMVPWIGTPSLLLRNKVLAKAFFEMWPGVGCVGLLACLCVWFSGYVLVGRASKRFF